VKTERLSFAALRRFYRPPSEVSMTLRRHLSLDEARSELNETLKTPGLWQGDVHSNSRSMGTGPISEAGPLPMKREGAGGWSPPQQRCLKKFFLRGSFCFAALPQHSKLISFSNALTPPCIFCYGLGRKVLYASGTLCLKGNPVRFGNGPAAVNGDEIR